MYEPAHRFPLLRAHLSALACCVADSSQNICSSSFLFFRTEHLARPSSPPSQAVSHVRVNEMSTAVFERGSNGQCAFCNLFEIESYSFTLYNISKVFVDSFRLKNESVPGTACKTACCQASWPLQPHHRPPLHLPPTRHDGKRRHHDGARHHRQGVWRWRCCNCVAEGSDP